MKLRATLSKWHNKRRACQNHALLKYLHVTTWVYNMSLLDHCLGRTLQELTYEPVHEISNNVVCATSKASVQPAHTRSLITAFASRCVKLHTENHLKFLGLKIGFTGSSESALVKMPHCWKSRVKAHIKATITGLQPLYEPLSILTFWCNRHNFRIFFEE